MNMVNILIADENPDVLQLLEAFFHRHWHNISVTQAAVADKIIEQFETTAPSLIVISLPFAQNEGWNNLNKLRADQYIPIVGLTDHKTSKLMNEGLEKGIDAYLVKPFDDLQLDTYFPPLLSQIWISRQSQKKPDERRGGVDRRHSDRGRRWNDNLKKRRHVVGHSGS